MRADSDQEGHVAVRVRDLEIALVLAREMKAAAARSVDASLRVEQLQEVFGVGALDGAERARMQTALQMAGLEPQPSLLDAEPGTAIRFGLGAPAEAPPVPVEEEPAEQEPARQEAESAGSRRGFRRFGVGRAGSANGHSNGAPVTATTEAGELSEEEPAPVAEAPAIAPHDTATPADFGASAETVEAAEPAVEDPFDFNEAPPFEVADDELPFEVAEEEPPFEAVEEEPEPELEPLAGGTRWDEEPEPEPHFEHEHEHEHEHEPAPELAEPVEPVAAAPQPAHDLRDVVAALLPIAAIPVIVAALAGWRFGLPFAALSVIAAGWMLGRRGGGEPRAGILATLRASEAARQALKAIVLVSIVSAVAAVLLASVSSDHSTVSSKKPAPKAPAAAAKPKPKPRPTTKARPPARPSHHARRHHTTTPKPASPPPDDSTAGLVRVPPSSGTSGKSSQQTQTPQPTPGH